MLASDLLQGIYYAYRGKGASKTPVWGSEKANTALSIINRKQREWATDSNNRWASLFEVRSSGTIAVGTPSYNLPADFFAPADVAQVLKTDGTIAEFSLTQPQRRNLQGQSVYLSGRNPRSLTFNDPIDDSLAGGTLKVPAYFIPVDITASTDLVSVDDPNWLIYSVASELARNDPAKEQDFPTLLGMANDLYRKMVDLNNSVSFLSDSSIPNNMPTLGSQYEDWTL